jgi:hypothetical protein
MNSASLLLVTAVLAVGCALGLMHFACVIDFHVPFDPNEGWNAYFTQAAMRTGSPYPPAASLMINNYPPLSFYLVGAISKITGDVIIAGRTVSLASLLAVAVGIETAARQMGCNRTEALFSALFFTAGLMLTSDYAAMDDPQLLGHAVAMGGFVLALREPRTPRLMVFAALLFALSFFVKHNLIVLPAALALWLFLADRRHAVTFMLAGVVFLLIGLGLFKQSYGVGLFDQLASARTYSLSNAWSGLDRWLLWGAVPAGGAALLLTIARHDRHAVLCAIYAFLAIVAGALFLGGAGVDANAMFDADIAVALCAGLLLNRLEFRLGAGAVALVYAVPLALGMWNLDADWRDPDYWFHPMAEERAQAAAEIALLRSAQGPAVCEMLSLCYWAGKPAEVDVFNIEQAYLAGASSSDALFGAISAKRYAMLQFEQSTPFVLTPRLQRAVEQNYRIVRQDDDRTFFAPR